MTATFEKTKDSGAACDANAQCGSTFCVDGVCCETACGVTTLDCVACSVAAAGTTDGQGDVTQMLREGKKVALLSHGSDARVPSVHRARERWHSYDPLSPRRMQWLERTAQHNAEHDRDPADQ